MPAPDPRDHPGGRSAAPVIEPAPRRRASRPRHWDLVLACSLGGILGSWARYGVQLAVPHSAGQFPWATVVINATGSFLIGALMIVLLVLTSPHRLVRPFLGVGVLGGYTTYSTFAVDAEDLVLDHRAGVALGYVVVTVVVCAAAVWLSTVLTLRAGRALATARPHLRSHR